MAYDHAVSFLSSISLGYYYAPQTEPYQGTLTVFFTHPRS
jgi:hypothetical protein